jgi:anti-sigma regulatory factor (Ser/Thr protein kinase)/serine/threonine protein phosphatase PrpC
MKARVRVSSEPELRLSIVEAGRLARDAGLTEQEANKFVTAVSELGRNILKYAGSGEVALQQLQSDGRPGMEAVISDQGPGIEDLESALKDHYSTSGTLGLGLPGVKRLVDRFEIESARGRGTRVLIRLYGAPSRPGLTRALQQGRSAASQEIERGWGGVLRQAESEEVDCAYFIRPCLGERLSGDAVIVDRRDNTVFLALIDGLGHGPNANQIAMSAQQYLRTSWEEDLPSTAKALHQQLNGTDGAAAGMATLDLASRELRYLGVGNVMLRILGPSPQRLSYTEGTLGAQIRVLRPEVVRLGRDDVALMFSDGVSDRVRNEGAAVSKFGAMKSLVRRLVQQYGKSHDDASCVAVRCP